MDETFKGTIRKGDDTNYRLGNLTYHKHIASLNHEQNILTIKSTQTTFKIAIGISAGLLILIVMGVLGYKIYKIKTNGDNSNNTQTEHGNIQYNVNDPNAPVIYRQNGYWNNGPYHSEPARTMGNNCNQSSNGTQTHQPTYQSTPRQTMAGGGGYGMTGDKTQEDPFYSILMTPILSDLIEN